jgi:hypothetical protein
MSSAWLPSFASVDFGPVWDQVLPDLLCSVFCYLSMAMGIQSITCLSRRNKIKN